MDGAMAMRENPRTNHDAGRGDEKPDASATSAGTGAAARYPTP
jgi:hypothetical protein